MKRSVRNLFMVTVVTGAGLLGCNSNKVVQFEPLTGVSGEQIISNRPQSQGAAGLLIKLPSSPILMAPEGERADLAMQIQKEQSELEAKLKALSSEIHVIYRYRLVVNGIFVVVPGKLVNQVQAIAPQAASQMVRIERPEPLATQEVTSSEDELSPGDVTSVSQIGATKLHEQGVRGQNIRVGIIDTGIDYTHKMLGGPGSAEVYSAVLPDQASEYFPNKMVVGGMDFVGTKFNANSLLPEAFIPVPDMNPLDEAGHGTHVAGSVAGHGDGKKSYDGVAPDAQLFALKVFGKDGSTTDSAVIAALEWAADPNADLDLSDKLDVVNLSLGSSFGTPQILYNEAIRNLTAGGTVVVASAGNSGPVEYITGAPAVADTALSVAASIDNMKHNIQAPAFVFKAEGTQITAEGAEAAISKPIKEIAAIEGELVHIGTAKQITEEQKSLVQGKVALIDRGEITFAEKLTNAEAAGAMAVVVANNQPGAPIVMGGNGSVGIPAIMIRQDEGQTIKAHLSQAHKVTINFKLRSTIEKPELADTLTDFSSRGPRSVDGMLKPEISAPGNLIISAAMGEGDKVVKLSGTSMSAPHMAGVMALMKQKFPTLSVEDLKSLVMSTTKPMVDPTNLPYPLSRQGAGRVQVDMSAAQTLVFTPAALSLGRVEVETEKTLVVSLKVKNLEVAEKALSFKFEHDVLKLEAQTVSLSASGEANLNLKIKVLAPKVEKFLSEQDGFIKVLSGDQVLAQIPVLALVAKISNIVVSEVKVAASDKASAVGSLAQVKLENKSVHGGRIELFNLLGSDARKENMNLQTSHGSTECDLESVGYRVVTTEGIKVLQVAMKLYRPVTTWNHCEMTLLVDANRDGVAEQELSAIRRGNVEGLGDGFASVLFNATRVRELRKTFETELHAGNPEVGLSYAEAVEALMPMVTEDHSSLVIVQAPLEMIQKDAQGFINISPAALNIEGDAIEMDDYLGQKQKFLRISALEADQGFLGLPTEFMLVAGESKTIEFTKGQGRKPLVVYMPANASSRTLTRDRQTARPKVKYLP